MWDLNKEFFEVFCQNKNIYNTYNEKLFGKCTKEEWVNILYERARVIREIFQKNEELLHDFEAELQKPLTEDRAQVFYELLNEMYLSGYDDAKVMLMLGEKLAAFYEPQKDYEHLVTLYRLLGFECILLYGEEADEKGMEIIIGYYRKIIAFREHYTEMKDAASRRCIFNAYSNLIAPLSHKDEKLRGEVYDLYREALDLWDLKEVQALDGEDPDMQELMDQMTADLFYLTFEIIGLENADERQIREIAERVFENLSSKKELSKIQMHTMMLTQVVLKKLTIRDAIRYFIRHIVEILPLPSYREDTVEEDKQIIVDYHDSSEFLFLLIFSSNLGVEEERDYLDQFMPKLTDIFYHIPYNFETALINYISTEWYKNMAGYLPNRYGKMEYLEKMVILRQPFTYIHCVMVAELAQQITYTILDTRPELFCSIPHYETLQKVKAWRRELLEYIYQCAILHDVGKCSLVETINQQSRKITDMEFDVIRMHPENGMKFLKNDPDFAGYYDVMRGHHKFYNGKGGYPADFDNTASPIRIIIDIITLADCMDAALDYLGRTYSSAKTFEKLLEEFREGAGTRYNPDLVTLIEENSTLKEKLKYISGEGRVEIYYHVYEKFMMLK